MSLVHPTAPRRRRRLAALGLAVLVGASGTLVAAAPTVNAAVPTDTITTGTLDWGVKASFRSYVTGPIAHGSITPSGGTTVNGDGTYHFAGGTGTLAGSDVNAGFTGSIAFQGHDSGAGPALDLNFTNPRVVVTGATGSLIVDANSRTFTGGAPGDPVFYDDVAIASLNLTGITPTTAGATKTWSAVPATVTSAGAAAFGGFYPAGTVIDPVTFSVDTTPYVWTPQITVSKTTGVNGLGEVVTVTGTGFKPDANAGTRPPVPPPYKSGIYVVFGRFGATWKPSASAPSTARQVIDQKWPLPQASKTYAETNFGANAQYVVLNDDGSFTTTLTLKTDDTKTGSYAVTTYAAGGAAANASQETYTPISFAPGTVKGRVVDESGNPVSGARAFILDATTGAQITSVSTSKSGNFSALVPPTKYKIRYQAAGFLTSYNGGGTTLAGAPVLTVPSTGTLAAPDAVLYSSGTVSGTVTELGSGAAIQGSKVSFFDPVTGVLLAADTTNPAGFYSVSTLAPGTYKIQFKGAPTHYTKWAGSAGQTKATAEAVVVSGGPNNQSIVLTPVGA